MKKSVVKKLVATALIFAVSPAFARDEGKEAKALLEACMADLSVRSAAPRASLTVEQAEDIVGPSGITETRPQIMRAIHWLRKNDALDFSKNVDTMETLLTGVRRMQYFTWNFHKFTTEIGAVGFYSDDGQFILMRRDGRMFFGKLDLKTVDFRNHWNGSFLQIREIRS